MCPFHPGFTPAHAGNTRLKLSVAFKCQVHPRSRGEYCVFVVGKCIPTGFTPAHAGNTGFHALPATAFWVHPRSRGEYISPYVALSSCPGSPPLTRGIPVSRCGSVLTVGFTPAHAGNTDPLQQISWSLQVHPRSRGEYYRSVQNIEKVSGFTPAHAGNTLF